MGVILMLPRPGEFAVRWTIRLSLIGWWLALVGLLTVGNRLWIRRVWTLSWTAFVIHVIVAFEYVHHWSHTDVVRHTEAESGFGSGVFVSYAFGLLWTVDVLCWELAPKTREQRPRWLARSWIGFMVFLVFNSTIIYETGPTRWSAVVGFVALAVLWGHAMLSRSATSGHKPNEGIHPAQPNEGDPCQRKPC